MYYGSFWHSMSRTDGSVPANQTARDAWRSLWEQHVAWTRMTILSAVYGLPGLPATSARLLRNADDMGALMGSVYGSSIGTGFAYLIRKHLQIALDLVAAASRGDANTAAAAETTWFANADNIAVFLSGIDPNWNQQAVRSMLYEHLALTKAEALAELSGDYAKSIYIYDEIEKQALGMADTFASGMIKQLGV